MFNVASSLLLVALALNAKNAFGTNQHLTCTAVDCVYSDGTPGQAPMRRESPQGPPGKRGQTGVKGEPGVPGLNGEQGLPGLVDPEDIENVVQEKVTEVNRDYQGRIETLEEKILELTSTVQVTSGYQGRIQTLEEQFLELKSSLPDLVLCYEAGGLIYKRKCYYLILRVGNYANAREFCTAEGEKPADILNAEHQSSVADYVRKKTSAGVNIWLGMSYRISTGTLCFSNGNDVTGDVAASIRWLSGWPISSSLYEGVGIYVTSTTYGLVNYPPNTRFFDGVLCEK